MNYTLRELVIMYETGKISAEDFAKQVSKDVMDKVRLETINRYYV